MANYKPRYPITINFGKLTVPIPVGGEPIVLDDFINLQSAADALLDGATGSAYQVTTGKTFHCVGIYIRTTAVASSIVISEGDTEDAETITKATLSNSGSPLELEFNHQWTIASGKFITHNPASTRHYEIRIYGYEI